MTIFFFSILVGRLEEEKRGSTYYDFVYMLFVLFIGCNVLEHIVNMYGYYIVSASFCMGLYYIFSKKNPDEQIQIFFVFSIKARYFPWAMMIMDFLEGGSIVSPLIGIGVGH